MNLSTHFTLEELVATQVRWVDNMPSEEIIENLKITCVTLERVRSLLGHPMLSLSGYRCPDLNAAIGGSRNSRHMLGLADDFICPAFGTPYDVCKKIAESEIEFDQLILEFNRWTHIGLAIPGEKQRREILSTSSRGHYVRGLVVG